MSGETNPWRARAVDAVSAAFEGGETARERVYLAGGVSAAQAALEVLSEALGLPVTLRAGVGPGASKGRLTMELSGGYAAIEIARRVWDEARAAGEGAENPYAASSNPMNEPKSTPGILDLLRYDDGGSGWPAHEAAVWRDGETIDPAGREFHCGGYVEVSWGDNGSFYATGAEDHLHRNRVRPRPDGARTMFQAVSRPMDPPEAEVAPGLRRMYASGFAPIPEDPCVLADVLIDAYRAEFARQYLAGFVSDAMERQVRARLYAEFLGDDPPAETAGPSVMDVD